MALNFGVALELRIAICCVHGGLWHPRAIGKAFGLHLQHWHEEELKPEADSYGLKLISVTLEEASNIVIRDYHRDV
jgi:hypothetical protein